MLLANDGILVNVAVFNQSDDVRRVLNRHRNVRRSTHDHSLHARANRQHVQRLHRNSSTQDIVSHARRTYASTAHYTSDVNKDWTCKDKDKDKDQAYKDQDKDKDFTYSYLLQVAAKPTIAIKQQQ